MHINFSRADFLLAGQRNRRLMLSPNSFGRDVFEITDVAGV